MAGSIADNSALYKKKTFTYVPPTPPAELIESTSYTLDFASRKFVHIGFDPSEKLQVVVHLLTSSRYVHITTDFMKKIFGFMGHILSFISDTPQKYKRVIFYEDEKMKLSSMIYSGENVLVIETNNRDGCRVLLNRGDLLRLQYLECSIFESIVRKEVFTALLIIKQYEEIVEYLDKKCRQHKSPPKTVDEMVVFIKNIQDDRVVKSVPNFYNQIQMCAAEQLAESLLHQNISHEYSNETTVISPMSSPTPMSPPTSMSTPPPTSPPPSFTMQSPSRAVDENDGPLHFNSRSLSKTYNFDSAVSEMYFVPKRKLF
ncbi:uncharacterized protein LOC126552868 isoform X1 [Aphis gossypii]|uniref:uncharacterized protein LOC126552868 isoform X1 n=1 Tax=Aphis gossypii TaxID=80765 RepID=UPI0021592922|nr:uncharacterized protein LOC126552868 isoform X1 [Aphis gossypii]